MCCLQTCFPIWMETAFEIIQLTAKQSVLLSLIIILKNFMYQIR